MSSHQHRERIYLPGAQARQQQFIRQQINRQQQQRVCRQSKFADARKASRLQTNQALNHLLSSTLIKQICPCCGCEIIANSQTELDKMMREHNAYCLKKGLDPKKTCFHCCAHKRKMEEREAKARVPAPARQQRL